MMPDPAGVEPAGPERGVEEGDDVVGVHPAQPPWIARPCACAVARRAARVALHDGVAGA